MTVHGLHTPNRHHGRLSTNMNSTRTQWPSSYAIEPLWVHTQLNYFRLPKRHTAICDRRPQYGHVRTVKPLGRSARSVHVRTASKADLRAASVDRGIFILFHLRQVHILELHYGTAVGSCPRERPQERRTSGQPTF
jgi:hypothetical protein